MPLFLHVFCHYIDRDFFFINIMETHKLAPDYEMFGANVLHLRGTLQRYEPQPRDGVSSHFGVLFGLIDPGGGVSNCQYSVVQPTAL